MPAAFVMMVPEVMVFDDDNNYVQVKFIGCAFRGTGTDK